MDARQAATIDRLITQRQLEIASATAHYFVALLCTIHAYKIPMPRHTIEYRRHLRTDLW